MDVAKIIVTLAAQESPYFYLTRFFDDIYINHTKTALSARPKPNVQAPMNGACEAVCDLLDCSEVDVVLWYVPASGSYIHTNSLYPRSTDVNVVEVYFHAR